MPRIVASQKMDASPEVVFRVIESPNRPLLPEGGPRLIRLSPAPGVGAVYRWEFRRLGIGFRAECAVTTYEPGRRMVLRGTLGWDMSIELLLRPEAGGSLLIVDMTYRFPAPVRWLVPGALIRLGVWHALRSVKGYAEEAASA